MSCRKTLEQQQRWTQELLELGPPWAERWQLSASTHPYQPGGVVDLIGSIILQVEAGRLSQLDASRLLYPLFFHPAKNDWPDGELIAIWVSADTIISVENEREREYEWQELMASWRRIL